MDKNFLLLIDLTKNFNLNESNKSYIYLNRGNINLENCTQIKINKFNKIKKKSYSFFLKYLKSCFLKNNKKKNFFLYELELMNLRIDRYDFIDRIINLLTIKHIILKKKIKKIKIISDDKSTLKIFDNMNLDIEKEDLSKNELKLNLNNLKILKFYSKVILLILYIKLSKSIPILRKKKEFYLSIYPNHFPYAKDKFFEKEKNICNFLLTDETHLNLNLFGIISVFNILKKKKIFCIEQFIKLRDVLKLTFKNFFLIKRYNNYIDNTVIDGLDFGNQIKKLFNISLINRAKLEIYSNAIPRFLETFKIRKMNLYLFEYNFGFFLIRNIKEFSSKIKIVGYQHGIFSNQLTWFDFINLLKNKNIYFPDYIFSSNRFSLSDYKSITNRKVFLKSEKNGKKDFINAIKINKKSKKILVLPGTHDIKNLYHYIKNKQVFFDKKIFYFKLHPKNKFEFKEENNIKKIDDFKSKSFSDVIISQTSSLVYDFLNLKKKFSVIDFDYRRNLVSTKLNNKLNFIKY